MSAGASPDPAAQMTAPTPRSCSVISSFDSAARHPGIDLHVKPGDAITAGQPLFTLLADDEKRFARALDAVESAYEIGAEAPASGPLVLERITA